MHFADFFAQNEVGKSLIAVTFLEKRTTRCTQWMVLFLVALSDHLPVLAAFANVP